MTWRYMEEASGGFVVQCRLCGKGSRRLFKFRSNTDTARTEAAKAAHRYWRSHERYAAHLAALDAYQEADPTESAEERVLREIFGGPEPAEEDLRLSAARSAYKRADAAAKKAKRP